MSSAGIHTHRIAGFGLTSADASRLEAFYTAAFGARSTSTERLEPAQMHEFGAVRGGARRHILRLGHQELDILQFDTQGNPYPEPPSPYSTVFQHFAIVVSDMRRGLAQLQRTSGWRAISSGGPQRLPHRSGGATAFKFQDPEGHPLELLQFADYTVPAYWLEQSSQKIFLGIDHTAISVRDTQASMGFYESLGFSVAAQSHNHGIEQADLDGVRDPQVEVTALAAHGSTPHLELLCYKRMQQRPIKVLASNDVAATRIRLAVHSTSPGTRIANQLIVDPDGHHLHLVSSPPPTVRLEGDCRP